MTAALAQTGLTQTEIVAIPTIYPSGGEKQLIQILTGKEVPHGQLAFDIGLFCQNVGTCVAITRALEQDQPLISRVVTISGDNIRQPGNWEVRSAHRFAICSNWPEVTCTAIQHISSWAVR